MLGGLMGSLIDTESITRDTIQSALEKIREELNCSHKEFFVMIAPIDEEFNMKFFIFKLEEGKPKRVREISLKEILGK